MGNNETTSKLLKDIIDKKASDEEFVSYEEILKALPGFELKENESISCKDEYRTLITIISRELRKDDLKIDEDTKEKTKYIRYKEEYRDYFTHQAEEKKLKQLEGDAKTLFLTKGMEMLLEDDTSSIPNIELECITELLNLCLVKILSKYLNKSRISFDYNAGYKRNIKIEMSPHYLKEYNSRWFLFGNVVRNNKNVIINCALDRIIYKEESDIKSLGRTDFVSAPKTYYKTLFKDIVGVTHIQNGKKETITIKTKDYKIHHLLKTKPIHSSQKMIKDYSENGQGVFTINIIPNMELQAKLLQFGPGIQIEGTGKFVSNFTRAVKNMARLYSKNTNSSSSTK